MTCPTEAYRDRRVIHALRPTPIVRGITKADCRPLGFHWAVPVVPAALAIVLTLKDLIGGAL